MSWTSECSGRLMRGKKKRERERGACGKVFESHSLGAFPKRHKQGSHHQSAPSSFFFCFYLRISDLIGGTRTAAKRSALTQPHKQHVPCITSLPLPLTNPQGAALLVRLVQRGEKKSFLLARKINVSSPRNIFASWKAVCVNDDASTDQERRSAAAANAQRRCLLPG